MSLSEYNAVSSKVKALYGKRLTQQDFDRLSSMKTVSDIASYLRTCPGWQKALESLPPTEVRRGILEEALTSQLQDEYSRIFKFMTMEAKHFLLIFVYRIDLLHILITLRRLQSGVSAEKPYRITEFYAKHSTVDHEALDKCEDYLGLLNAVTGSMFYEPLRGIIATDASSAPDYTRASLALQSSYYITMHRFILRNTKGDEKKTLLDEISGTVDLMNVSNVMRVKERFPGSINSVTEILIPRFFKLKPSFFRTLYDSPDIESAMAKLRNSPYARLFSDHSFEYIDQYQMYWRYSFDKKQLLSQPPSVYTPIAYISLKRYELNRLIAIIECVRYGLPADTVEKLIAY